MDLCQASRFIDVERHNLKYNRWIQLTIQNGKIEINEVDTWEGATGNDPMIRIHVAIQRLPLIKSKNNRNSPTAIDTQNNYYTTDSKAYLTLLEYWRIPWMSIFISGCQLFVMDVIGR